MFAIKSPSKDDDHLSWYRDGYCYFVQVGHDGPIKIGKSVYPWSRLDGIQTGSPDDLRLLLLVSRRAMEPVLHEMFKPWRIRGEWFHPSPELLLFIEEISAKATHESTRNGVTVPLYRQPLNQKLEPDAFPIVKNSISVQQKPIKRKTPKKKKAASTTQRKTMGTFEERTRHWFTKKDANSENPPNS